MTGRDGTEIRAIQQKRTSDEAKVVEALVFRRVSN